MPERREPPSGRTAALGGRRLVVAAAETLLATVLQRLAAGPATPAGAAPTGRSAATAGRRAPGLDDAGGGLVVEDAEGDTAERHQESEDPQGDAEMLVVMIEGLVGRQVLIGSRLPRPVVDRMLRTIVGASPMVTD